MTHSFKARSDTVLRLPLASVSQPFLRTPCNGVAVPVFSQAFPQSNLVHCLSILKIVLKRNCSGASNPHLCHEICNLDLLITHSAHLYYRLRRRPECRVYHSCIVTLRPTGPDMLPIRETSIFLHARDLSPKTVSHPLYLILQDMTYKPRPSCCGFALVP